ncbi:MAG: transglutaminase domain-containing protein, partial [Phycisphaerae bacterium]|nr:transglutaminase domain-containing protein [Phycisphaerae bacterium]
SLRWNVTWRAKVWNTQLNDAAAAAIAWPQEWPAEVQQALKPQPGIESDAPEFKQFVQRVSEGRLRQVTPFIAAKELIRSTVQSFRTMDKVGLRQENNFTRGLVLQGAYAAMQNGNGSSHDVVASCVAVLRAAEIPARAVVGMSDSVATSSGATKTRLLSWGEFYLPDTGWIPFDVVALRGAGNSLPPPERAWPNFGSWDDLNQRVPLSFAWSAPAPGASSLPYPAVWSWTASGYTVDGVTQDAIGLQMLNRGRVQE